jgi:two-component system phosphoglycerate transport system response regulator PgtA
MLSNECSILLIDDDADVLDAYTQLLEQAGYHVHACDNPLMRGRGCRTGPALC